MPAKRLRNHSANDRDSVIGLIVLIVVLFYVSCTTGCINMRKPEPAWAPDTYSFYSDSTGYGFVNGENLQMSCDDPDMHEMVLIPYSDLLLLAEKFDQCKEWR